MLTVVETDDALIATFTTHQILAEEAIVRIFDSLNDVCSQASQKKKGLVLDFKNVQFMSSAMLGRLVLLNKAAKTNDVILRFCNVAPNLLGPDFSCSVVLIPRGPKNLIARVEPPNESA